METYSASFLYHDFHFAGVDTLRHMNIKHILHLNSRNLAKALIQSDLQKESSMGCCQFLALAKLHTIMATMAIDAGTFWMLIFTQYALTT